MKQVDILISKNQVLQILYFYIKLHKKRNEIHENLFLTKINNHIPHSINSYTKISTKYLITVQPS